MSQGAEMLDGLLDRINSKADLSVLLHCLMSDFGGPGGLSKFLREEFDQLHAGSPGRTKILTTIIDLMKQHTPDEGEFSEEDLVAYDRYVKSEGGNGDGDDGNLL